jgi:hypothetical protein
MYLVVNSAGQEELATAINFGSATGQCNHATHLFNPPVFDPQIAKGPLTFIHHATILDEVVFVCHNRSIAGTQVNETIRQFDNSAVGSLPNCRIAELYD